jgi:tRNA-2-methylthio-N6-dimethylallyladenosine synthase
MEYVKYNFGYMYSYSERPGTLEEKWKMTYLKKPNKIAGNCRFNKNNWFRSEKFIGQTVEVLVEKVQKKLRNWKKFAKYYVVFKRL